MGRESPSTVDQQLRWNIYYVPGPEAGKEKRNICFASFIGDWGMMKGNETAVCGFNTSREAGSRHSMFKFTITEKKMKQTGVTPIFLLPPPRHMYSRNHPGPRCPVISGRKAELPGWGTMKSSRIDLWPLFSLYFLPSPAELQNVEPPKASSPSFGQFTSVPSLNKRLMITFLHYTERGIISIVTTYLHLLRIRKQTNKGEISLK